MQMISTGKFFVKLLGGSFCVASSI